MIKLTLCSRKHLSKPVGRTKATVLVLESGRTRATQARHAIDRLLAVRANVVGAILTKFDMQNAGYGYGYGYDYGYGER